MRLFRLTLATIFRRKTWVLCALAVALGPFAAAQLSSGTENPTLLKPAIAQAAWVFAWLGAIFWGFFSAASAGHGNARSGLGEYFATTGITPSRQLLQIWLAVITFVAPLGLLAALVCILAASPAQPDERVMWIGTNLQYSLLFALVVAPLVALAIAVASRFGNLVGFLAAAGLTSYGLYGVGYLGQLLDVESNGLLAWLWKLSPHYHFADPTERLRHKLGALQWSEFPLVVGYFAGLALLYLAGSRLLFRIRARA